MRRGTGTTLELFLGGAATRYCSTPPHPHHDSPPEPSLARNYGEVVIIRRSDYRVFIAGSKADQQRHHAQGFLCRTCEASLSTIPFQTQFEGLTSCKKTAHSAL